MDIQTVREILKTIIKILTTETTTLLLLILFLATDKILSHIETVQGTLSIVIITITTIATILLITIILAYVITSQMLR